MGTRMVIPHRFGFIPKDVIVSGISLEPNALDIPKIKILYNDPDFNAKTIAIEVDQPCKIRMFVGSYEEKKK